MITERLSVASIRTQYIHAKNCCLILSDFIIERKNEGKIIEGGPQASSLEPQQ